MAPNERVRSIPRETLINENLHERLDVVHFNHKAVTRTRKKDEHEASIKKGSLQSLGSVSAF